MLVDADTLQLAGKREMPVIVRNYTDDEATIIMVDSNIQREDILPSEKAKAYKMKYEAMKHQGKKSGRNTLDEVGEAAGENAKKVQRYIWLSPAARPRSCNPRHKHPVLPDTLRCFLHLLIVLHPERVVFERVKLCQNAKKVQRYIWLSRLSDKLLTMVDGKKLGFSQGVDISFLAEEAQQWVQAVIEEKGCNVSMAQSAKIKEYGKTGELTLAMVRLILYRCTFLAFSPAASPTSSSVFLPDFFP